MSGDFPTSTLEVTDERRRVNAQQHTRVRNTRVILQLVDEDVWNPNVGCGYGNLLDLVEIFGVPHQELICP